MSSFLTRAFRRLLRRPSAPRSMAQRRMLVCESLEDRSLLANLDLGIQLWTVDGNNKGVKLVPVQTNPTTYQINKDTPFFVQILAEDSPLNSNDTSTGIVSLPIDVKWNTNNSPTILHYSGTVPTSPIDPTNLLVTTNFPLQRGYTTFNVDQGITVLRGASLPNAGQGSAIGIDGCVSDKDVCREFSLIKMTGSAAGISQIDTNLNGGMSFTDGDRLDTPNPASVRIQIIDPGAASSLSGYVYADADQDGVRDVGPNGEPIEIGLPNVTVSLFIEGTTAAIATTTSGPDGFYHFENLQPGRYRIVETQPAGFNDGAETLGVVLPGKVTRGTVGADEFNNISLAANEHGVNYNFAEILSASSISKRLLLSSTPPMPVVIAQRLGINAVAVQGTDGNDSIAITNNGTTIQVKVNNGPAQTFDISTIKMVVVDAGAGNDTVTIQGASAKELANFQPAYVGLRRDDLALTNPLGYGILVMNAEHNNSSAVAGQASLAVYRDSPGSDAVTNNGNVASITWATSIATAQATTYDKVRIVSISGGTDTVNDQSHNFVFERLGDWL